jgi:chitin disaccharide deacetylase
MRYLIVNADDFGISPEVTKGIIEAFIIGIVTDTSILICSPYAEQALANAIEVGLPVGIHIDFVTEFHLHDHHSDPNLIGPNGQLTHELNEREFHNHIDHSFTCDELITLRDEIRSQVNLFIQLTGQKPSHLDYHFGLHYINEIMAIYITIAEEYQIPVRWGRQYAGKSPYAMAPKIFCDAFKGHPQSSIDDFVKLIEKPWEGVMEICCHPGYFTPGEFADKNNQDREYELTVLVDPRLKVELHNRNIQLVNYHFVSDLHARSMRNGGK